MDYILNFFKKVQCSETEPLPFITTQWNPKPKWNKESLQLLEEYCLDVNPIQISFADIIIRSEKFQIPFPTENNRCKFLIDQNHISQEILNRNINSVYPVIHETVLNLCCEFLIFKRRFGNDKEKSLYNSIGVKGLIDRLIRKRAVCFLGSYDKYMLLDQTEGSNNWETIGTNSEIPPLIIDNYMSYDELKLAALLSISSYTHFINNGKRNNSAIFENERSKIESEGIIIGMVGPRLHRSNAVEFQEVIITEKQNTKKNGFGLNIKQSLPNLFAKFYEEDCLTYNEMVNRTKHSKSRRYIPFHNFYTFDNMMFYKRLTISIDTLLGEANGRAKRCNKFAYVHVVGIGLGVWKISPHQDKVFMDTFSDRIKVLGDKLTNISDIYFAYMKETECGEFKDGDLFPNDNHPKGGIYIHFGKKEPHNKLEGEDEGKLLVVSYAWDGNALPGNEYWFGSLTSSGDPAAACSTQITEIHNPHINKALSADCLRIVCEGNVLTLDEYKNKIKEEE